MVTVIGVKFRNSGRVYYFDPGELDIQAGQGVVVETARGVEYGDVTMGVTEVEESAVVSPLKPVQRVATDEDVRMRQYYWDKEKEAFPICEQKIKEHGLDMKLVNVEYNLTGSKVVFYFTADDRVDFRELVKDLAYVFKTRIELRQIGVRDEAKMLGFPIVSRAVCPREAHSALTQMYEPIEFETPIVCGGVIVNPGDLIVADEIGVAVVPAHGAEQFSLVRAQSDPEFGSADVESEKNCHCSAS